MRGRVAPTLSKYGEFSNVLLTEPEYSELVQTYGKVKTDDYISRIDYHIASKGSGKHYKHFATIKKWIAEDERKHSEGKEQPKKGKLSNYEERTTDYNELERKEREFLMRSIAEEN